MAAIDISSTAAPLNDGVLQLQNGVAMDSTLRNVADQNDTTSPLKLSTTAVQVVSPLRITTDDPSDMYLDCEDGATNNRFNITRNTASQQVNLNFASNPAGSTTIVGAIRTYVDGTNLSDVMEFMENGNIGVPTALSLTKLNVVTPYSALNTDFTFSNADTTNAPASLSYSSFTSILRLSKAYSTIRITNYGGNADVSILCSGGPAGFLQLNQNGGSANVSLNGEAAGYSYFLTNVGFGLSTTPTAKLHIKGSGSTSATTSLLVQNSSGGRLFQIQDDGTINTSVAAPVNINFLLNVTYDITARGLGGNSGALNLAGQSQGNASATMVNIVNTGSPAGTIGTSLQISSFPLQGATHFGVTFNGNYNTSVGANTLIGYDFSPTNYGGSATLRAFQSSVGGAYINTTSYNASAILQADSTTQGFLPPRMTNAQRAAITTPAIGLMVYCTDAVEGIYVYKSTGWTFVA